MLSSNVNEAIWLDNRSEISHCTVALRCVALQARNTIMPVKASKCTRRGSTGTARQSHMERG